ncbi:hypothetical protein [uncultured Duncaniella sp.]|uniref:hypothetical protein n=1 Tax=uncultured Duncaniella sp. TaxID=2768039 RepID=UPI002601E97B|nr:hypothetical protein [uncultured Duncaniella sp.]
MGKSHAFFVVRGAFAATFTGFCVFSVIMAGESWVLFEENVIYQWNIEIIYHQWNVEIIYQWLV